MDVGSTQECVSSVQDQRRRDVSCASGESETLSQCFPEIDNRKFTARDCAAACSGDPPQARTASGVGQNASGLDADIDIRPSFCGPAASRDLEDSINPSSRLSNRAAVSARTAHAVASGLHPYPGSIEIPPLSNPRLRTASRISRVIGLRTLTVLSLFLLVPPARDAFRIVSITRKPFSTSPFRPES